jgi:dihydrofolate synthase/folylpolyglutamate synthase
VNFAESEAYLLSLGNEVEAMKLGLDNIRKLLAALGDPQKKYLKVQVAGTNGKGSVCAFLNSICLEAGIKTGLYTSPHLVTVTERVKIDGFDISEDDFARLATLIRLEAERLFNDGDLENLPTFFEQVTAIALVAFADADVELAILETGLGGRFDAVTAANAEICAITRIDLDHQQYLGETIEEIAAEKAAIIHKGSKAVIGEQQARAMNVVLERCREAEVSAQFAWDVSVTEDKSARDTRSVAFSLQTGAHSLPLVFPPVCLGLPGKHQIENAKIAVLLAETLKDSFQISNQDMSAGLKNARHPGRLEWIRNVLLDGAHNVGGAKVLAAYLDEFVDKPITIIFGAMREKNVAQIAGILWLRAERIILTSPRNSRALSAEELRELKPENIDEAKLRSTGSVEEAITLAKKLTSDEGVILITGSLYLVGEARNLLTRGSK